MHPADFADADTLTCTLAAMLYRQLQRSSDPARTNALNEFGLVLPWEQRSAAVRNVWESVVRQALESMAVIGDGVRDLRIYTKPAALELEDGDTVIQ
jgi:lauroyl/myristoyl acyltransferase